MWLAAVLFAVALVGALIGGSLLQQLRFAALLAWAIIEATGLADRSRAARWFSDVLLAALSVLAAINLYDLFLASLQ